MNSRHLVCLTDTQKSVFMQHNIAAVSVGYVLNFWTSVNIYKKTYLNT